MKLILSGEGPTDIGNIDYTTRTFNPGPMAYFIDGVVRENAGFSPLEIHNVHGDVVHFISRTDLVDQNRKGRPVLPGKKTPQGKAYFLKNAYVLGEKANAIACTSGCLTIAVLFRDSDPTKAHDDYEEKYGSIMTGFKRSGFNRGVPMIPRQIMEAWLLDSLDWRGEPHPDFDSVSGGRHSAHPYKEQLAERVGRTSQSDLVDYVIDGTFDQNRITVSSYHRFKARLKDVLDIDIY